MATEITANLKSSPPAMTRAAADLVERYSSAIEAIPGALNRYALSAAVAPTVEARQALVDRKEEIDRSLAPASPDAISRYIGALKVAMPSRAASEDGAAMEMRLTIKALEDIPEWAIADVCRRFLDGRLGAGRFAPTPAEIAQECRALLLPHRRELATIGNILGAEIYTEMPEESRARLTAMLDDVAKGLKANSDPRFPGKEPEPFIPPEEREERALKHAMAVAKDFRAAPPALSEATIRKLETEGHIDTRSQAA